MEQQSDNTLIHSRKKLFLICVIIFLTISSVLLCTYTNAQIVNLSGINELNEYLNNGFGRDGFFKSPNQYHSNHTESDSLYLFDKFDRDHYAGSLHSEIRDSVSYNDNGQIQYRLRTAQGKKTEENTFQYNDTNNSINETIIRYDYSSKKPADSFQIAIEWYYDDNHRLKKKVGYDKNIEYLYSYKNDLLSCIIQKRHQSSDTLTIIRISVDPLTPKSNYYQEGIPVQLKISITQYQNYENDTNHLNSYLKNIANSLERQNTSQTTIYYQGYDKEHRLCYEYKLKNRQPTGHSDIYKKQFRYSADGYSYRYYTVFPKSSNTTDIAQYIIESDSFSYANQHKLIYHVKDSYLVCYGSRIANYCQQGKNVPPTLLEPLLQDIRKCLNIGDATEIKWLQRKVEHYAYD